MRWDKELESKLRDYQNKKRAINNIKDKIGYLDESLYTLKPTFTDRDPIQGGGSKQEDIILNKIMEKDELEKNLKDVQWEVNWVDTALSYLDDIELKVIERLYLDDVKLRLGSVCDGLGYEKSQIYNIKNRALYKMTIAMYGKVIS